MFRISIFILLLFSGVRVSAIKKKAYGSDLGIGVKGGLNFNKPIGTGWLSQYKTDPHAGFFVHLNKKRFGAQVEAVWSQNHFITDSDFKGLYEQYINKAIDSLENASFRFSSISIPLLLNVKLTEYLWIQLGPQFSANVNILDQQQIIKSGLEVIAQRNYHVVGGLWWQSVFDAPLIRFNAGIRFIAGVANLNLLTQQDILRNQQIQVHVGISY